MNFFDPKNKEWGITSNSTLLLEAMALGLLKEKEKPKVKEEENFFTKMIREVQEKELKKRELIRIQKGFISKQKALLKKLL